MQSVHKLAAFIISVICYNFLLPILVEGASNEEFNKSKTHKIIEDNSIDELSHQRKFDIQLHGLLLWISMGFLMPVGIVIIRMSNREEVGSTRLKLFFYLHVIFQTLSVLLATAGAVMSIKKFENSFDNSHQRIGLALYIAVWVQAFIGIFRPHRGKKERSVWYLVHWILGTIISLVGIINIYTGLNAYHKKTSKSISIWTIIFTVQVSFIGFFYLFQDKWEYMQKQGVILWDNEQQQPTPTQPHQQLSQSQNNPKELPPQPCPKRNSLKNLFA